MVNSTAFLTIAIVTVFSLDSKWLGDPSGKLGLERGIHGWSKYAYMQGYDFKPYFFVPDNNERLNWNRAQACLEACKSSRYDWVFWTESDVWVTNYTTRLEEVIALAGHKHVILNYDAIGNPNAGSGFVKCSAVGRSALTENLALRTAAKTHYAVQAWDTNGAWIAMLENAKWKHLISILPSRAFNSYPKCVGPIAGGNLCFYRRVLTSSRLALPSNRYVPDWTQVESDDPGFWQRGDFIIHFAGFYRGGMFSFDREYKSLVVGEPETISMFDNTFFA